RRHNLKRGAGIEHISLDETALICPNAACPGAARPDQETDLIALDAALEGLARIDPRKVQVVEMRYFGGLSVEETAAVLKVSTVTVKRDWRAAKTWLFRELTGASTADAPRTLETS